MIDSGRGRSHFRSTNSSQWTSFCAMAEGPQGCHLSNLRLHIDAARGRVERKARMSNYLSALGGELRSAESQQRMDAALEVGYLLADYPDDEDIWNWIRETAANASSEVQ